MRLYENVHLFNKWVIIGSTHYFCPLFTVQSSMLMTSGEDVILIHKSIIQGHHVHKDIWHQRWERYWKCRESQKMSTIVELCMPTKVRYDHWPCSERTREQVNVVYKVPCTCRKVYIGETTRRLETRLKEHKDACIKGFTDKSAIAEHAWTEDHPIRWGDTRIMQHAMELVVKEAICIRTTPESSHFNRGGWYDIPGCTAGSPRTGSLGVAPARAAPTREHRKSTGKGN